MFVLRNSHSNIYASFRVARVYQVKYICLRLNKKGDLACYVGSVCTKVKYLYVFIYICMFRLEFCVGFISSDHIVNPLTYTHYFVGGFLRW